MNLQLQLYKLEQFANTLVTHQLEQISLVSIGIIFLAGLLTSFSPCMLSMLPITVGYMGGYAAESKGKAALQSIWFALGLSTTLAMLGIVAAALGKIYGQVGFGLPIIVSVVAILMGLNLLEIIPLQLPTWGGTEWISPNLPTGVRSYLLGLSFGIVASPCSTPVLATLLAWVAKTGNLGLGGVLLLTYAIGYATPLVVAGTFTATIKNLLQLRQWGAWINPLSGVLLLGFGVFSLLLRFFSSQPSAIS